MVYIYTYIYTYIHICVYVHMYTHTNICASRYRFADGCEVCCQLLPTGAAMFVTMIFLNVVICVLDY